MGCAGWGGGIAVNLCPTYEGQIPLQEYVQTQADLHEPEIDPRPKVFVEVSLPSLEDLL
jgi:hypothetical protein